MPRRQVKQLQPFERGRIVGLRETEWTYRRIAAHVGHNVSVVCRCFQQWSVEHSHTRRPGSERPRSRLQTHVNIDALYEQWWPPEQHPGKKSEHMLLLLCHQRPLGTVCLQQDSAHVCLWPVYHLHRQARLLWCRETVDWRVEWRSVQ